MTTASEQRQEGRQLPAETAPGPLHGQERTCAISVTQPSSIALDAVTRSGRWTRVRLSRLLARPESRDGGRPTFPAAREWHHKCAGYYGVPLLRWLRLAWGYAHLLAVKPATDFADWVAESPARSAVAVAVFLAVWYGR